MAGALPRRTLHEPLGLQQPPDNQPVVRLAGRPQREPGTEAAGAMEPLTTAPSSLMSTAAGRSSSRWGSHGGDLWTAQSIWAGGTLMGFSVMCGRSWTSSLTMRRLPLDGRLGGISVKHDSGTEWQRTTCHRCEVAHSSCLALLLVLRHSRQRFGCFSYASPSYVTHSFPTETHWRPACRCYLFFTRGYSFFSQSPYHHKITNSMDDFVAVNMDDDEVMEDPATADLPSSLSGMHNIATPFFMMRTFDMIEDPLTNEIVSWSSAHNNFIVWDCNRFSTNKFSDFIRQLNIYGIQKMNPEGLEFAQKQFLRGQRQLLKNNKKRRNVGQSSSRACVQVGQFNLKTEIDRQRRDQNMLMGRF